MKREIKFRAYDTKENKWLYGYDMPNLGGFSLVGETVLLGEFGNMPLDKMLHDVEIMQYTGLNDKNGVEIYEGDIVKYTKIYNCAAWGENLNVQEEESSEMYAAVEYYRCEFRMNHVWDTSISLYNMPSYHKNGENHQSRWYYIYKDFEVIGNIHQHPHLLTPPTPPPLLTNRLRADKK